MKEINSIEEYNEVINGDKPVLLDFFADWCGPCQTLLPIVSELAEENKEEYIIAKINVDKNPDLARQHSVRSIPALFFIENKKVTEKLVGLHSKSVLNTKIQQHLKTAV